MKRAFCVIAALAAAGLTACMPEAERPARDVAGNTTGWTQPPQILSVRQADASLIFSGHAEPGARVVLRSDQGAAYAAAADPDGRFEIRMIRPRGALLLRPETQVGQDAAPSPDRLLIIDGGRGPIAVLRSGGPTRRLDPAPPLGAIDSDARSLLASGHAESPGAQIEVSAQNEALQVVPGNNGVWSVLLGAVAPGGVITVGDQAYVWPGPGADNAPLQVERAGQGWRVGWSGPGGARQWTWMPDNPATA
ncbi:hypothetical protein [Brevundimonas sp. FT23042]|uniref:hypothetical protein n=1 Tax=Brevundimonas sp. FT23042 TaxID=3393749 RepID=UPI003B587B44